jgi:hypothetical protein
MTDFCPISVILAPLGRRGLDQKERGGQRQHDAADDERCAGRDARAI